MAESHNNIMSIMLVFLEMGVGAHFPGYGFEYFLLWGGRLIWGEVSI